jgi:hypothetical protein
MSVSITSQLRQQLLDLNIDPEAFTIQFAHWKANWPVNEYAFELFGKDGAYATPTVDGEKYVLRHVHMQPSEESSDYARWQTFYKRRSRKTSDRHLIYVTNSNEDHLLIFLIDEPDAHAIALMKTAADRQAMEDLAIVAENFLWDGTVE